MFQFLGWGTKADTGSSHPPPSVPGPSSGLPLVSQLSRGVRRHPGEALSRLTHPPGGGGVALFRLLPLPLFSPPFPVPPPVACRAHSMYAWSHAQEQNGTPMRHPSGRRGAETYLRKGGRVDLPGGATGRRRSRAPPPGLTISLASFSRRTGVLDAPHARLEKIGCGCGYANTSPFFFSCPLAALHGRGGGRRGAGREASAGDPRPALGTSTLEEKRPALAPPASTPDWPCM